MSSNLKTEPDLVDLRTESERVADAKIENLNLELANLQAGAKLIIERHRPSWCKGHLESITVGDEGIDLDYLIKTWGGHLLSIKVIGQGNRIRGSHSIELYSFEPRKYGKLIRAPHTDDDDPPPPSPAPQAPVVVQQNPDNGLLQKMLEMMLNQQAQQAETFRTLLLQSAQQSAIPPSSPPVQTVAGFGEMLKMINVFNKLKETFQSDNPSPGSVDTDGIPGQIMDMAKMFFANREPDPKIIPPQGSVRPAQILQQPRQPQRSQQPNDLISQLAVLNPNQAADTLLTALGRMDPSRQQKVLGIMRDKFYSTMPEFFDMFEEGEDEDEDEQEQDAVAGGQGQNPRGRD